jgi:hypothetical protein
MSIINVKHAVKQMVKWYDKILSILSVSSILNVKQAIKQMVSINIKYTKYVKHIKHFKC